MIGIMQPYFLPYLGHIQLMAKCNTWVIFDDIQFIDKGWINRNKILHPDQNKKFQFITIPLKNRSKNSLISSLEIDDTKDWRNNIKGKFSFYKKKTKFFSDGLSFLNQILNIKSNKLSDFLYNQMIIINDYFNLNLEIFLQSKDIKQINYNSKLQKGDWAIEITKFLKKNIYINPESGINIFNKESFAKSNIELKKFIPVLNDIVDNESQNFYSIIDTLARIGYFETKKIIKKGVIKNM